MQIKYEEGICLECGLLKIIVHKSKCLCYLCLNKLRTKKYMKSTESRRKQKGISSSKDKQFYEQIWKERGHICYETGKFLGETPSLPISFYMHHLLEKRNYPQYRYEKWNIVMLHPDIHQQVEINPEKCTRTKALREELLEKYGT
jgi:hypothetical protein